MNDAKPPYWFLAKRYGWGWGPPATWQGWVVLVTWIAILLAAGPWLLPRSPLLYGLFVAFMVAVLIAIGYAKGEPPRWRWR